MRKKRSVSFEDEDKMKHCSVIATRALMQNKEDLCTITIPYIVGLLHFSKALCDLSASIYLMLL